MDDPALDAADHRHALAGLARINALSRAGARLWTHLLPLIGPRKRATILDVAAGSADVLIDLVARARRSGVTLEPQALDVSAEAISVAAARARSAGVELITNKRDALRDGLGLPDASVDIVVCSLFLHHLQRAHAVSLLREMARVARAGVAVSDLVRSRRAVIAAALAGRALTRSPIVHVDAVRSVRGAFTTDEMRSMAAEAGMAGAAVIPTWPLRMTLAWSPP